MSGKFIQQYLTINRINQRKNKIRNSFKKIYFKVITNKIFEHNKKTLIFLKENYSLSNNTKENVTTLQNT